MKQENLSRAMLGGFLATLVMTLVMYLVPSAWVPRMDIAAALGSAFGHGTPAMASGLWWAGMVWHFVNGSIIFALLYALILYSWLPGADWLRGLTYGIILWVASEAILMPAMGSGFFSDHSPHALARVLGNLIAQGIYGVILGAIAGEQAEHSHQVAHPA